MDCPCGSRRDAEQCCRPVIAGARPAATAEELLRSRYTAFADGDIDYLLESVYPDRRAEFERKDIEDWSLKSEWRGLEILDAEGGGPGDAEGKVEFVARYVRKGEALEHHELAEFKRKDGKWYFLDGKPAPVRQYVRAEPKVNRNDPCPCGSGKKYKKCHGS